MLLQLHQHTILQREQLLEAGKRHARLRSRLRRSRSGRLSGRCARRGRSTSRRGARRFTCRGLDGAAPDVCAARSGGRHGLARRGRSGRCRRGRSRRGSRSRCGHRCPSRCGIGTSSSGTPARRCGSRCGCSCRTRRRGRARHGGVRQCIRRLFLRMGRRRRSSRRARRSRRRRGSGRCSRRRHATGGRRARRIERRHIEHGTQLQPVRIVAHERARIRVEQGACRTGKRGAIVRLRDVDRHVVERLPGAYGVLTGGAGTGRARDIRGAGRASGGVCGTGSSSGRSRRGLREARRQERHGDCRSKAAQRAASLPGPNRTSGFNGIESNDHWNRLRVVARIVLGMETGFAAHNKKAPRLARRFLKVGYAS